MNPWPSLQAIVVCDTMIEDRNTGKKNLIGDLYLRPKTFPCHYPSLMVYFCLTDAEGTYTFSCALVHADHDKQIAVGTLPHRD